jgi:hypothetical protein
LDHIQVMEPIIVTILDALKTGLGRTKLYEMISSREIDSVTVGTPKLVVLASLRRRLTPTVEGGLR